MCDASPLISQRPIPYAVDMTLQSDGLDRCCQCGRMDRPLSVIGLGSDEMAWCCVECLADPLMRPADARVLA